MSVKGVSCAKCFHVQEGEFEMGQEIQCENCQLVYPITYDEIEGYKAYHLKLIEQRAKQRRKEIEYENMGIGKKLGLKTLQVIGGTIGLLIIVSIAVFLQTHVFNGNSSNQAPTYRADGTMVGTKADAQYFSQWDGSNRELVEKVKQGMHDPSSFEHVETRFGDKGKTYRIMMTFRGKNAFNAVVTQSVTATLDKETRTITEMTPVQ
ncbi:hypothetical protein E6P74_05630 [Moraxella lacunata]|uniref:Uncharacterized protein n=1 Tax=Moraxella lacunata TaxID=477 RepID=A0A1B8Q836_MORLA|nr:hypothetical protein [Moraxella lacunata]MDI4482807.1 hypothetical protein [Moraxella lacunata]MDI4507236.1 hypothetical protein [Moraxella lacunata]OBX61379.1 hypothetical protein A9Z63_08045 [Moraxella lacunata]OBX67271.1 hypothetical protein A9309_01295 [Moraxella lacunata]